MKTNIVIVCCGDSANALAMSEAIARTSESSGSVILVDPKDRTEEFIEQCLGGFQLPESIDSFDVQRFEPKQKYTCFGKPKKR